MGGGNTSTQKTNSKQKSTSAPYPQAQPTLNSLLSQAGEIAPVNQGQFVPGVNSFASDLLNAGHTGIGTLQDTAGGKFLDQSNPYLGGILADLNEQARTAVGSEFAHAGRSVGGQYENALVKALTNSQAPYLFNNYQFERGNQQNAAAGLGQTGLQVPGLLNQSAALPFSGLSGASNFVLPIASAFPQNKGKGTNITIGSQSSNPFQTVLGAGLGGLGLLGGTGAFGPTGWGSGLFG